MEEMLQGVLDAEQASSTILFVDEMRVKHEVNPQNGLHYIHVSAKFVNQIFRTTFTYVDKDILDKSPNFYKTMISMAKRQIESSILDSQEFRMMIETVMTTFRKSVCSNANTNWKTKGF